MDRREPEVAMRRLGDGANRPTVFPNLARQHVRPLTSGPTRVKGSRGVSLATADRAENPEAIGWSAASGDALMRASAGLNVHASHGPSDTALRPQSRCVRGTTSTAFLASESGRLCERRRRPTTLDPVTSHAPRSHIVSTTRPTTSERQRAGICGASGGPNGVVDAVLEFLSAAVIARAKLSGCGVKHGLHNSGQRAERAAMGFSEEMQELVVPSQREMTPASVAAPITSVRTPSSSTKHA
ncbi:hypothetical protein EDB83DRAFT_2315303 [Lactarius deliciosus]|nr:hypothetical protein EDB83DRAFT_2315303 [Lactarius deliciosus]